MAGHSLKRWGHVYLVLFSDLSFNMQFTRLLPGPCFARTQPVPRGQEKRSESEAREYISTCEKLILLGLYKYLEIMMIVRIFRLLSADIVVHSFISPFDEGSSHCWNVECFFHYENALGFFVKRGKWPHRQQPWCLTNVYHFSLIYGTICALKTPPYLFKGGRPLLPVWVLCVLGNNHVVCLERPSADRPQVVLVCFLGGCSYAEIAALRFLSQREDGKDYCSRPAFRFPKSLAMYITLNPWSPVNRRALVTLNP